jgi:hypothetical protein
MGNRCADFESGEIVEFAWRLGVINQTPSAFGV